MSEEADSGFKVKDKRRFDDSGNLKSSEESSAKGEAPSKDESSTTQQGSDFVIEDSSQSDSTASEGPTSSDAPLDYSSFVLSLATQAMIQLGEMPSPPGVEIPKNPEAAKHSIEVIEMLQQKTKGNLVGTEEKLTEEILHNLRLAYVKHQ